MFYSRQLQKMMPSLCLGAKPHPALLCTRATVLVTSLHIAMYIMQFVKLLLLLSFISKLEIEIRCVILII